MRAHWSSVLLSFALAIAVTTGTARAEGKTTLRMATVAPEGSGWSRELAAFARTVARRTENRVEIKFYWGGVAGDEKQVAERISRGQLDGTASGGMLCGEIMPSMRVLRVPGTCQDRDEAAYLMAQLNPRLELEARKAGFELLGYAGMGPSVVFSRKPIKTMAELRKTKMWRWEHDDVAVAVERMMGMDPKPLPLRAGSKAYDRGEVDAFYAIPSAALAFQWYVQVGYLLPLAGDYLTGCLVVKTSALDQLSDEDRQVVEQAATGLVVRMEELGRRQDAALLGGVFEKHGLRTVPVSKRLRAEFFAAARKARANLDEKLVSKELLTEAMRMLADYRAEHAPQP